MSEMHETAWELWNEQREYNSELWLTHGQRNKKKNWPSIKRWHNFIVHIHVELPLNLIYSGWFIVFFLHSCRCFASLLFHFGIVVLDNCHTACTPTMHTNKICERNFPFSIRFSRFSFSRWQQHRNFRQLFRNKSFVWNIFRAKYLCQWLVVRRSRSFAPQNFVRTWTAIERMDFT